MKNILDEWQISNEKKSAAASDLNHEKEIVGISSSSAITYPHPTGQLLLSRKLITHLPEAGLNPLVDSAGYLFYMMGKLKQIKWHRELKQLHDELVQEIEHFQQVVKTYSYKAEYIAEYIPITCYVLCLTLDDIISSTAWGGQGKWDHYSLVTTFIPEPPSQRSFFIILERLVRDPDIYIDVMELMYICLSFGFKCKNDAHSYEFNDEQLEQITDSLYKRIRAYRNNLSKVLAPHPIRAKPASVKSSGWKKNLGNMLETLRFSVYTRLNRSLASKKSYRLLDPKLLILENRLKSAMQFIKKTTINKANKSIKLRELPWYFLLGNSGCGKTTMLANAHINYVLKKQFDDNNIYQLPTTETYDFWITGDSVIIDTPGNHLTIVDGKPSSSHRIWQYFLELVQYQCKQRELGGVIFAISVSELVDKEKRNALINQIEYHLQHLTNQFGHQLHFYFSITKCDLLPGFADFFNECSREELLQAWGITIPKHIAEPLSHVFIKRFNALIKKLNNQVIWRLHQERNAYAKFFIKNFPLQLEHIKEGLLDIIHTLEQRNVHYTLKGIYLNSAIQQPLSEQDINHPEATPIEEFPQILEMMHTPSTPIHSYFIKQFILQGIIQ